MPYMDPMGYCKFLCAYIRARHANTTLIDVENLYENLLTTDAAGEQKNIYTPEVEHSPIVGAPIYPL